MAARLSKTHNLAWRKLLSTHVVLIEQIEKALTDADLPPLAWYDILFAISEAPERKLRLYELAQSVLLSRSNVTRIVTRLEKAGLLQREQCDSDYRGSFAVISTKGLVMLEQMWLVYEAAIVKGFAHHLDVNDAKLLIRLLNHVVCSSNSKKL